jgi:lysyl-tRNA synthetase class II
LQWKLQQLRQQLVGQKQGHFKSFHNDYQMDVFMRIDIGELWQKRLLAGGFEKVYQIGKAYRNEGSSVQLIYKSLQTVSFTGHMQTIMMV